MCMYCRELLYNYSKSEIENCCFTIQKSAGKLYKHVMLLMTHMWFEADIYKKNSISETSIIG